MTDATTLPDDLADRIEATRITYPPVGPPDDPIGVTIEGSAFGVEFDEPVDPEAFCRTVATPAEPWHAFGIPLHLSEDYWKLSAVLLHIEDGVADDASTITLEVAPEWARVYVKEGCDADRAAEFLRTLDAEYGIEVEFPSEETDPA